MSAVVALLEKVRFNGIDYLLIRGANFPGNQQSRETGNTGNPEIFSGREIREIGK